MGDRNVLARRRDFIALLGGAAAWPRLVQAQSAMPVIGFFHPGSRETFSHLMTAFRQGLGETGFVEGRNVTIAYRWADGKNDLLPTLANELVRIPVAVIAGPSSTAAARAAKAATTSIPIVFAIGADPVKVGLVSAFNRPGGNVTGRSYMANLLIAKRFGLLKELVPRTTTVGMLMNANNPNAESDRTDAREAAGMLGLTLHVVEARTVGDFEPAFATFARQQVTALFVNADPLFTTRRDQLVALAARHAMPAIYDRREFVAIGGLISYGADQIEEYRQMGIYTGRVLKGEKPGDLPIQQSTKFDLMIHLKTAKTLGLGVPPTLIARADEVIE
jgi:putative tryptophan/tyrosine transport system substrate-binding protein